MKIKPPGVLALDNALPGNYIQWKYYELEILDGFI